MKSFTQLIGEETELQRRVKAGDQSASPQLAAVKRQMMQRHDATFDIGTTADSFARVTRSLGSRVSAGDDPGARED